MHTPGPVADLDRLTEAELPIAHFILNTDRSAWQLMTTTPLVRQALTLRDKSFDLPYSQKAPPMADLVKPIVVACDIDGTVADCRHRQHHTLADPPDWEAFFAGSDVDSPLTEGVALALRHAALGHLAWLTGRPERYRDVTTAWLRAFDLPTTRLHMRPDDDMRPAPVFKAERLARLADEHEILLVVDDDELVVATLRYAGWPVHHAKWMSR